MGGGLGPSPLFVFFPLFSHRNPSKPKGCHVCTGTKTKADMITSMPLHLVDQAARTIKAISLFFLLSLHLFPWYSNMQHCDSFEQHVLPIIPACFCRSQHRMCKQELNGVVVFSILLLLFFLLLSFLFPEGLKVLDHRHIVDATSHAQLID